VRHLPQVRGAGDPHGARGAVTKYMEVSINIAREYGVSSYTLQRLELLDLSIKSLFENDKSKQVILSDFM